MEEAQAGEEWGVGNTTGSTEDCWWHGEEGKKHKSSSNQQGTVSQSLSGQCGEGNGKEDCIAWRERGPGPFQKVAVGEA